MRWTDAAVRAALGLASSRGTTPPGEPWGGEVAGTRGAAAFSSVVTDTRTMQPGALFVALRGERYDAHVFLTEATYRGARGAVVERVPPDAPSSLVYYVVDDTLAALGRLARYQRRRLASRVCAITGTVGKTATKELARAALAVRYRVHATSGNLNNLVGAPLTILSAPDDVEALVVEVGTNAPGEIARLRAIVEPDVVIITTVAEGHLEGLGSLEGVLAEKTALLGGPGETDLALVGDEPPALAERARRLAAHVRVAGTTSLADPGLRATSVLVDEEGRPRFEWRGRTVRLAFRGSHHVTNALLALGLAEAWGVDLDAAAGALAWPSAPKLRGELRHYGELRVIADCYNSNPPSLRAAVDLLMALPRGDGRVAVLGTMKELGTESMRLHRAAAESVLRAGVDLIVATGEFVQAFGALTADLGERLIAVQDPLEAFERLAPRLRGGEVVLLKGSRGVELERLLPRFEALFQADPFRSVGVVNAQGGGR